MSRLGRFIAGAGLATSLVLLGAAAASADSHEPSADAIPTGASPESPSASEEAFPPPDPNRYPSLDVPTVPWAYDTDYYFALTRGLERDAGVTNDVARGFAMVGTVIMDLVTLPGAALAGLFGT
jgi:hypothetical protein